MFICRQNWLQTIVHPALLLLIVALLINQETSCERLLSVTPCAYPLLSDTLDCGIDDPILSRSVSVCDPDKAISMSEVEVIKEKLDKIYAIKNDRCVCSEDKNKPCWFRFGFAFLKQIFPVESGVSSLYSRDYCPSNETLLRVMRIHSTPYKTRESLINYGENFVRILRERWLMGKCDEDILFLIVLQRPEQLIMRNALLHPPAIAAVPPPYIFASHGSVVQERIDDASASNRQFLMNYPNLVHKIIETENANLENGYPLKAVIERLLDQFAKLLTKAEDLPSSSSTTRSHIPDWAVVVFIICALLCICMAVGLCLMRTSVRRSTPRNKPLDTSRRWKAGFVGENMEGMPTGGVNLMQMLIQPSSARYNVNQTSGNY